MSKRKGYWCPYHQEILLLLTDEEYKKRVENIKQTKPPNEVPIRLANFLRVKSQLPEDVITAGNAYDKARDAYNKAWDAYDKARDAYGRARDAYDKARDAYNKAWDVCDKARDAYDKALGSNISAIQALYEKEVPRKDQAWNWGTMQLNFKRQNETK